jgi:S-(hydroxymethyl)glutathione dehydrogenase/alcohol dehydrogenase
LQGTLSLGTLATHTVVHAAQVIPLRPEADLSRVCLLGCGASTGVGAAVNTAGSGPARRSP